MRKLLYVLVAVGVLLTGGYLVARPRLPAHEPYIKGTLTKIEGKRILVEEQPHQTAGDEKGWFDLTDITSIYADEGIKIKRVRAADLEVGQHLWVWPEGPIRESYPVQAKAGTVLIRD